MKQEVKQTLATIKKGISVLTSQEKLQVGPHTFAQVAAKPKEPHPNHTLIISSKIKTETSDNVITKIRDALDLRKTGALFSLFLKLYAKNFRSVRSMPFIFIGFRIGFQEHLLKVN